MKPYHTIIFGLLPMLPLLLWGFLGYGMLALDAHSEKVAQGYIYMYGALFIGTLGLLLSLFDDFKNKIIQNVLLVLFIIGGISFIIEISSSQYPLTYLMVSPMLVASISLIWPPNKSLKVAP